MKNKFLKVFATLTLLSIVIVGCDETNTNTDSQNISENVSDTTSNSINNTSSNNQTSNSDNNSSGTQIETLYNVTVVKTGSSKVTPSVSKASEGDVVTITVVAESGYVVTEVKMGDNVLTDPEGDGTYSFVMPNTTARISVSTDLVDKSGIVIVGDGVSAKLIEESANSGIYVARNITISKDCNIGYTVDGGQTYLSVLKIDNEKSFANIGLSSGDGFTLAGNAVYDFYYDTNDAETPCYIQRVGVINLPQTAEAFASLMDGNSLRSESTLYPVGVSHVEYMSKSADSIYKWDLYSDNSSLAKITDLTGTLETGIVYKAQIGDEYKVVHQYLGDKEEDRAKSTDLNSIPYAGRFDIVSGNTNRYSYTQSEVDVLANSYSHSTSSLDLEFYQAYRNGYLGNIMADVETAGLTTVKSEFVGTEGDFKVNAFTWVRWENSSKYIPSSAYKTFELNITMSKSGAIKEASYLEYTYDSNSYDFASKQLLPNASSVAPNEYKTVKYIYGTAKDGQPNIDVSKYFVSSIDSVVVKGMNTSEGKLGVNETVECFMMPSGSDAESKGNVTVKYSPATALDTWQYSVQDSSNESVVGYKPGYNYYSALGFGTTTLTIGNNTVNSNDVKKTVDVTVAKEQFLNYVYLYTVYPYDNEWIASGGDMYAGTTHEVKLAGKPLNGGLDIMSGLNCYFEITSATSGGLKYDLDELNSMFTITYDNVTGMMKLDATKAGSITEKISMKVTIHSEYIYTKADGTYDRESTFTVNLLPNIEKSSLVGTWDCTDSNFDDYLVFTDDQMSIHLVDSDTSKETIYTFSYTYEASTTKIKASYVSSSGDNVVKGDYYRINFVWDENGDLGIAFCVEVNDWNSYSIEYVDILGETYVDDEGFTEITSYYYFTFSK